MPSHAKGLIGLSSCLKGEVASELRTGRERKALEAAAQFRDILGAGNFFLEMQYQGIDEQLVVNKGLVPIARDLGMPLVATNDVHYLTQGDHHPHDILLCIGTGKTVNDRDRMRYHGDQFYLKTADEMHRVFGEIPEALANTMRIAERCAVEIPIRQEPPAQLQRPGAVFAQRLLRARRPRGISGATVPAAGACTRPPR